MDIPDPPPCPPKLKAYLKILKEAALTVQPLQGRNTSVSEQKGQGTLINADDCTPCP